LLRALDKFINIRTRLILVKLKLKHRNGVKLKLDFDPRRNMSAFAYLTAKINSRIDKINDLLSMRKIAKNWADVALFRIGLKKTLTINFRDGKVFILGAKKNILVFGNLMIAHLNS